MDTNLAGRLRNTHLPVTNALLPLHEAIVNSIQAIDELSSSTNGRITVEIIRDDSQGSLPLQDDSGPGRPPSEEIIGFTISDNGVGFTEENFASFETLDSDRKLDVGGRGVGRLLWLVAFESVRISSTYADDDQILRQRAFYFTSTEGVDNRETHEALSPAGRGTVVKLSGLHPRFRKYIPKSAMAVARAIVDHCLWYFLRPGGAPKISLLDAGERIELDEVFDECMHDSAKTEEIQIKGEPFSLIHIKLRTSAVRAHSIVYCANNRPVLDQPLAGKVPGLHGKIVDQDGSFYYFCYVNSPILDTCVRPERTSFSLLTSGDSLFSEDEITREDIDSSVADRARVLLSDHLEENLRKAKQRISEFVSTKGPRYRPIQSRIPEEKLNIDPSISDKDLEIALHRQFAEIENDLIREGHDVMVPAAEETPGDYKKRINSYLRKAEDVKRSDLAGYVSHRKVILDLLEGALQRKDNHKYAREEVIHELIMPMGVDSNDVLLDGCNLWIIDESLAFHHYLASDKTLTMMPITGSTETKEPDLCAFNLFDNPMLVSEGRSVPLASITVVEIKRPMRNDARAGEKYNPIEQALGYLKRIREGQALTPDGRPIPRSDTIPGFCYALCDITPTVRERCDLANLTETSDRLGYFGYNAKYKAYIEVISFDRLVNKARERNRAFFDKLGLPTN